MLWPADDVYQRSVSLRGSIYLPPVEVMLEIASNRRKRRMKPNA
jgi:hypothetical protein